MDPYPTYARLRACEPVSWVPSLGMWYVTRYADVRAILNDEIRFSTVSERSLILDTFGPNMLSATSCEHDRFRRPFQPMFLPGYVRTRLEHAIRASACRLVSGFRSRGAAELRCEFASRLPIQTILSVYGLEGAAEPRIRACYDNFELALSNFTGDASVRANAQRSVAELHQYFHEPLSQLDGARPDSPLGSLALALQAEHLNIVDIKRNLAIIFFGGISTVEALILNCLWALFAQPSTMKTVTDDVTQLPKVIDETLRWLSPVQSATRHVVHDTLYNGIALKEGDIVNCMLGAASRDPEVFADPDRFDIGRTNAHRHLAFGVGTHSCLGFHLAKTEARIALEHLLGELPGLRLVMEQSSPPEGYEFRQPRRMTVAWDV